MTLPAILASEAIQIALGLGKCLPRTIALRLFSAGGSLYHLIDPRTRRLTIRNLQLIYGDSRKADILSREVYREMGRNVVDLARLELVDAEYIDQLVEVSGMENLSRAIDQGRGVIGITGHIGNWELLASYLGTHGVPLTVMTAQVLSNRLDRRLTRLRARHGVQSIFRSRPGCLRESIRVLRRGEMLGLLMDLSSRSACVDTAFLGYPARTVAGPVRLAGRTGAQLIPMACWRTAGDRFRLEIGEVVPQVATRNAEQDIVENTHRCVQRLEKYIHTVPAQWVWMHDRWGLGAA